MDAPPAGIARAGPIGEFIRPPRHSGTHLLPATFLREPGRSQAPSRSFRRFGRVASMIDFAPGRLQLPLMNEADYFSIVEATHDIQNPTSPGKLREVAERLEVGDGDRVLDIGSGRGFWPVLLAERGADVVGLEINPGFAAAAERRAAEAGVQEKVRTVVGPAADFPVEPGGYAVASCLGASFALGGYRAALERLSEELAAGGRLAIGDLHSTDGTSTDELPSLAELVHIVEEFDFEIVGIVAAGHDDWDRYESLHWKNAHDWAVRNPEHPDREAVLADSRRFRNDYLANRGQLGWTIVCGVRKG